MEGDGDNRAQPGAAREPEQEWVREWIPDQRLESDARDTKRAAHQKSEQRTRQPELPDDRRGQQVTKRHVGGPEQQRRAERRKDGRREQDVPHRAASRRRRSSRIASAARGPGRPKSWPGRKRNRALRTARTTRHSGRMAYRGGTALSDSRATKSGSRAAIVSIETCAEGAPTSRNTLRAPASAARRSRELPAPMTIGGLAHTMKARARGLGAGGLGARVS